MTLAVPSKVGQPAQKYTESKCEGALSKSVLIRFFIVVSL